MYNTTTIGDIQKIYKIILPNLMSKSIKYFHWNSMVFESYKPIVIKFTVLPLW